MKSGFSLVEVLIFVTILALFFVTAAAVITTSLNNTSTNQHKILATHYAEELLEWLRSQKESDWNAFTTNYTSPAPGKTYCFPDLSWNNAGACGSAQKVASIFTRQAILTNDGNSPSVSINTAITVTWNEPSGLFRIPLNSVFYIWE